MEHLRSQEIGTASCAHEVTIYTSLVYVTTVSSSSIWCQTKRDSARRRLRRTLHAGDDVLERQPAALAAGRLPCICRAAAECSENIAQPRPAAGLLLWGACNLRSQSNAVTTGKLCTWDAGMRAQSGQDCRTLLHIHTRTVDI